MTENCISPFTVLVWVLLTKVWEFKPEENRVMNKFQTVKM